MIAKTNRKLARKYGGIVRPFNDQTLEVQAAIAWYMAVSGEAWDLPPKLDGKFIKPNGLTYDNGGMPEDKFKAIFVANIGHYHKTRLKIGTVNIPTEVVKAEVMARDPDIVTDWKGDWDGYHKWYLTAGPQPNHDVLKPLWPCILSCMENEVFEDGWHRFHSYVRSGVEVIPCAYFTR